jgi:hypothetical protein
VSAEVQEVGEHPAAATARPAALVVSVLVAVVVVPAVVDRLRPLVAVVGPLLVAGIGSVEQLVELATVEPDASAGGAVVDLDALPVGDGEAFVGSAGAAGPFRPR